MNWSTFPDPPRMSANGKIIDLLNFIADMEEKRAATHRAKELRAVAEWLYALGYWLREQRKSERTGA